MKISLNAIKEIYKQVGVPDFLAGQSIEQIAAKIGSQLGEIEEVIDLDKKYKDVVVVKVASCQSHPNADKLKVCAVDAGGAASHVKRDSNGFVRVVCGAPNLREGMLAAWLPPGSTVPATLDKDPFVLEARELRGVVSNGMLASGHELGINDDHNGILEVDKEAQPGASFAELYKLDDYIIDIENKMFTHRPDCFGLLGVAREIAGIYHILFKSPEWYTPNPQLAQIETAELKLEVVNEIPELVPRFCAIAVRDISIGPSPLWLQIALSKLGIKAISNIVDLTNFYMVYTGQPLHAFDYDKVKQLNSGDGVTLTVRKSRAGEEITVLGGKTIKLKEGAMMVTTNNKAIAVGGAIGGAETEVDENTKNIIIEAATWDMNLIRKTSMEYGIFTDAVTRFSKGQSYFQNPAVVAQIVESVRRLASGKVASKLIDSNKGLQANKTVSVSNEFINSRLGLNLKTEEIKTLLVNVEFEVKQGDGMLAVTAPFWRTDIEIPEDVVEEIGRLYGYDNLPLELPKRDISPALIDPELRTKQLIRSKLAALGANEVLSYSFVHGNLLDKVGQDRAKSYKLKNALSPDLQYYRQSLTPSLLDKVHLNIKAGFDNFALFELGKVHTKDKEEDGLPKEFGRAALVVASKNNQAKAYYAARNYLVNLLAEFGVNESEIAFESLDAEKNNSTVYYLKGRATTVKVKDAAIGHLGEYNQKVATKLKLPEFCAGFELGLEPLLKVISQIKYTPISKFPSITQDITLKVVAITAYAKLMADFHKTANRAKPEDVSLDINLLDIYQSNEDVEHKQITVRVVATSHKRTLNTDLLNNLLETVAKEL